jgi:predicted ATPase
MSSSPVQIDESEVLDLQSALVDKSLVLFDDSTGRFRMLETIRQYSKERIDEERAEAVRARHLAYFRALAEEAEENLTGPEQV